MTKECKNAFSFLAFSCSLSKLCRSKRSYAFFVRSFCQMSIWKFKKRRYNGHMSIVSPRLFIKTFIIHNISCILLNIYGIFIQQKFFNTYIQNPVVIMPGDYIIFYNNNFFKRITYMIERAYFLLSFILV